MFEFIKKYLLEGTDNKLRDVLLIIIIGYLLLRTISFTIRKLFWGNLSQQSKMVLSKIIVYTGFVIIAILVLKRLNFDIRAILGAAGIVGIVLGIASQTSIGNIISGIFLISEKSFEIGDLIRVGDKLGIVYSIDLLSLKLKTLDNLYIRIPNLTLISTEVTNITRFPIRRMDMDIAVAYKEDLNKVIDILKKLASENPLCLDEPEPLIVIKEFGDSGINIQYGIWFEKSNYVKLRNSILIAVKETFTAEGIEIPFPHLSIYTGESTKAYPVDVKNKD